MALNDVPILLQIEDSSFDHLAFYNSIMNDADIGFNLDVTKNVPTTPPPDSQFVFAGNDNPALTSPRSAAAAAAAHNSASLAASLQTCKAYKVLSEQEYSDTINNKEMLSIRLIGLETELEREIARKVKLSTAASIITSSSTGKENHHHRKPLFSSKLKFKSQTNNNITGANNNNSSSSISNELVEVNQKIQTLNQQIMELVREVKDHELRLLQHQAAVLAAANEQANQDALRRSQATTAKATTRMKSYSAQPADSVQEAQDKAVIDSLIVGLRNCFQSSSGVSSAGAGKRVGADNGTDLVRGRDLEGGSCTDRYSRNSRPDVDFSSTTNNTAAAAAAAAAAALATDDTVTAKLCTLSDLVQQLTTEVGRQRTRVTTAETANRELQRQHLREVQQLKRTQLAEIESMQTALDALSAPAVPLSVNILQREFKAMVREKNKQANKLGGDL